MIAVPEAWRLPRMPGSLPSAISAAVSAAGKAGNRLREIAPVEVDRRAGDLPMAGRRVLAARGLDAIAPLAARLGQREARAARGRSRRCIARPSPSASRCGSPSGPAPQACAVAPPVARRPPRYGRACRRPRRHRLSASAAPPQPTEFENDDESRGSRAASLLTDDVRASPLMAKAAANRARV